MSRSLGRFWDTGSRGSEDAAAGSWARPERARTGPTPPTRPDRRSGGSQSLTDPYQDVAARRGPAGASEAHAGVGEEETGRQFRNGQGLAALVCGIFGLLFMAVFTLVGLVLGIAAAVLGFLGRGRAVRGEADNGGQAMVGMVTGIIAVIISGAFLASTGLFVVNHHSEISQLNRCVAQAHSVQARNTCQQRYSHSVSHHSR